MSGVTPCESLVNAISSFPAPPNITDARSLFVASQSSSMGIFTKPYNAAILGPQKKTLTHFVWNKNLERAFQQSKRKTVGLVKKEVTTFDINRVTCQAPDWSKEGMGFLLLQKHYTCPTKTAPSMLSQWIVHCICRQQILH